MTVSEKYEISIILVLGFVALFITSEFPNKIGLGRLLFGASALLLLQSLIRDLWLLLRSRGTDTLESQKKVRCMCVESTVGVVGILIGSMLLALGKNQVVEMNGSLWAILIVTVLGIGFGVKDYVLEWNPWRIRRDKNHMNIIFTWKKS